MPDADLLGDRCTASSCNLTRAMNIVGIKLLIAATAA